MPDFKFRARVFRARFLTKLHQKSQIFLQNRNFFRFFAPFGRKKSKLDANAASTWDASEGYVGNISYQIKKQRVEDCIKNIFNMDSFTEEVKTIAHVLISIKYSTTTHHTNNTTYIYKTQPK